MRLLIFALSLCLAFPLVTLGLQSSSFSDAPQDNAGSDYAAVDSTTSGWSELYSGPLADSAGNFVTDEIASYSKDLVTLNATPPYGVRPATPSINRDQSAGITGITAILLLIGALRLYFSSRVFRKFLFDTFSPLSPLGY